MKRICIFGILIMLFMLYSKLTQAQPDFGGVFKKHGVVLSKNITDHHGYYYLPGDLEIAKSSNEQPDLNFIKLRYAGSSIYSENEEIRYRNTPSPKPLALVQYWAHRNEIKQIAACNPSATSNIDPPGSYCGTRLFLRILLRS